MPGSSNGLRGVPILLIDVVGFTKLDGVARRRALIETLQEILCEAARFFMPVGDPWKKWTRQGTGDGYYFLFDELPPQVALEYARRIGIVLANRTGADLPLEVRQVLAHGDVEWVDDQILSDAFAEAERWISSKPFKSYCECTAAAVAATDLFHHYLVEDLEARCEYPELRDVEWTASEISDKHDKRHKGWIADLGGKAPDALAAWLGHVHDEHSTLLSHFARRGGVALLEHVYVELRLREVGFGPRGPEKLEAHAPLTLRQVLENLDPDTYGRRWLLRGDPGSGKTTLLRHLAYRLAHERGDGDAPWVPVFLSLPRILRSGAEPLDALDAKLHSPLGLPEGALAAALVDCAEKGELLLLLDGLDEVPEDDREAARALLRSTTKRWPEVPLVVTTRPIGAERLDRFHELELLPFDDERRRRFLARWLGAGPDGEDWDAAEDAARRLESNRSMKELASNPLYLTLMAMLLDDDEPLPERRTRLYDRIFDFLLAGKQRKRGGAIEQRRTVEEALRHLGWEMTTDALDAEPVDDLEDRLWDAKSLLRKLGRLERWSQKPRNFLDDVAEKTGILGPHDGQDADWRYWHRTFREALVAECLEKKLQAAGEAGLLEHVQKIEVAEGQWGEPYALLVGRLKEPDALVEKLMQTNRALGLRALASAEGLRAETVDALLVAIGKESDRLGKDLPDYVTVEDWMARAEVYRRVPELLGNADDALELLDRLRRRTTDGNDLFFLDLAMVEVGQRWTDEEVAVMVEGMREQLLDHLAAPAEPLFAESMWREIPAGTFQMGSSRNEGNWDQKENPLGGFNRERPQHEVRITQPFRMASTPVTNAQYRAFDPGHEVQAWDGVSPEELDDHPAVDVSWFASVMFSRWLADYLPGVRLSTEEEWEYACRAGSTTRFSSGDSEADLERVGRYLGNSDGRTHRVGTLPANDWGLQDVHGTVWEWTQSPWTSDYAEHASGRTIDPAAIPAASPADLAGDAAATPGGRRVMRGGGFGDRAWCARSAYRLGWHPWGRFWSLGFRLVRPLPRPEP